MVLSLHLPSVQVRMLSGADHYEFWTEQSLWNAVLKNIRVVVSTHQVLLDALHHGFVQFSSLALLVFDEGASPTLMALGRPELKRMQPITAYARIQQIGSCKTSTTLRFGRVGRCPIFLAFLLVL